LRLTHEWSSPVTLASIFALLPSGAPAINLLIEEKRKKIFNELNNGTAKILLKIIEMGFIFIFYSNYSLI
jgi:hypothetical protein